MLSTITRGCQFGEFKLSPQSRSLERDGLRVPLGAKAFDVLFHLVSHAGQVVSKEDLLKAVWPDSHVDEKNLVQQILFVRKALGDCSGYIATIPGRGYQFTEPVFAATPVKGPALPDPEEEITHTLLRRTHVVLQESTEIAVAQAPLALAAPGSRAPMKFGIVLAFLALAGLGAWASWRWSHRISLRDHHEIVLADFDNATGTLRSMELSMPLWRSICKSRPTCRSRATARCVPR